jgi:hypothetical protein
MRPFGDLNIKNIKHGNPSRRRWRDFNSQKRSISNTYQRAAKSLVTASAMFDIIMEKLENGKILNISKITLDDDGMKIWSDEHYELPSRMDVKAWIDKLDK